MILKPGSGKRTINGRDFKDYFHSEVQNMIANLPFAILGNAEEWDVEGLMTRDSRAVERKKFGRKKARKHFQFSKR